MIIRKLFKRGSLLEKAEVAWLSAARDPKATEEMLLVSVEKEDSSDRPLALVFCHPRAHGQSGGAVRPRQDGIRETMNGQPPVFGRGDR